MSAWPEDDQPVMCRWFALCDHEADGVVAHPILGDVPTCQRCVDKLDLGSRFTPS